MIHREISEIWEEILLPELPDLPVGVSTQLSRGIELHPAAAQPRELLRPSPCGAAGRGIENGSGWTATSPSSDHVPANV